MKIALTLSFILWSLGASAKTAIIQGGSSGQTFMDASTQTLHLNVKTTYPGSKPKITVRCQTDQQGTPVKSYFRLKVEGANGVVRDMPIINRGATCKQIMEDPEGPKKYEGRVLACDAYSGADLIVEDNPNGCGSDGKQACTESAETTSYSTYTLTAQDQQQITMCSPKDRILIVSDKVTNNNMFTNASDGMHCKLDDKKPIFNSDAKWDKGSPFTTVHASHRPGFFIGNISHYFYDFKENKWCVQLRADLANSPPTCDPEFTKLQHAIDFAVKPPAVNGVQGDKVNYLRGAIKLTTETAEEIERDPITCKAVMDASGNPKKKQVTRPVAFIAHSSDTNWSRRPNLDLNQTHMKVVLSGNPCEGPSTRFETISNGSVRRAVTVSPTYTLGNKFDSPGTCDNSSCLKTIPEVHGNNENLKPLLCSKDSPSLDLSNGGQENLCYSCNGVSSGDCGNVMDGGMKILNAENIGGYADRLRACRGEPPTQEESTGTQSKRWINKIFSRQPASVQKKK